MNPQARQDNRLPTSLVLSDAADLPPRDEYWVLQDAEERLHTYFPKLLERLKAAALKSRCDSFHIHFAAEHVITVEALVETLETSLSAASLKLSERELDSDFRRRVIEKVLAFSERPITERELIKQVYAEIDPDRIALAHKLGVIRDQDVVWALQQPPVYFAEVLPKLRTASLLNEAELKELESLNYVERGSRE